MKNPQKKEQNLNTYNSGNNNKLKLSELKSEYKKRSKESKFVLGLVILIILYFSNTTTQRITTYLPNLWSSIIICVVITIFWWIMTKD